MRIPCERWSAAFTSSPIMSGDNMPAILIQCPAEPAPKVAHVAHTTA
jgi:hypothetical protein